MTRPTDQLRAFHGRSTLAVTELRSLEETLKINMLPDSSIADATRDHIRSGFYAQFDETTRIEAAAMAGNYELFYAIENSIRDLVSDTLRAACGDTWWDSAVPQAVRENVDKLIQRERDAAVTARSTEPIDYTTFGELSVIIEHNFESAFGDIFNSRRGVVTVLSRMNTLRGPIAHCSPLSEDEVLRLTLSLRDWFRLME